MGLAFRGPVLSPELSTPGLRSVVALARRVATIPASVLIVAERGGPAEAVARLIHAAPGDAPRGGWVIVQTAGRPDAQIEADVFGGGDSEGTVFIDSIHSLSLPIQARLSALLSGGPATGKGIGPRVIAATTVDLGAEVRHRRFRSDLLERFSAITISIPPLRKRPGDIMVLATAIGRAEAGAHDRLFQGFSEEAEARLSVHPYPGNEEELRRTVERAVMASTGPMVEASSIELESSTEVVAQMFVDDAARSSTETKGRAPTLSEIERAYVIWALRYTNLNRTAAARLLGISYPTIAKKIADYRIDIASLA